MPPGRNQPCPCGSGRKYKNCCGRAGGVVEAGNHLPPDIRERAREAEEWQVDLLALPPIVQGQERYRTVATLVVADGLVLQSEVDKATRAEVEDVAAALERALAEAAREVSAWPPRILVRRAEVAEALESILEDRECEVEWDPYLDELDEIAKDLIEHVSGAEQWPIITPPETWAAWGLPADLVADFFRAAAAFHRAAPWRWLDDIPPVEVEWEDGTGPWVVSVLGAAKEVEGIVLHSEADDLRSVVLLEPGPDAYRGLSGWAVHLGFAHRRELSRPMVKEISRAGWEVAGLEAYPYLMPLFTPGGGMQEDLLRRLTAVLRGIAAMAERHGEALRGTSDSIIHQEGEGGLLLRYRPEPDDGEENGDPDPGEFLRQVVEELDRSGVADEGEMQGALERVMDRYHKTPQDALGGISPDQARDLLLGGFSEEGPLRIRDDVPPEETQASDTLANARIFLSALLEGDGTPATPAGNLKRAFVAEMLERMRLPEGYLDDLHKYNKVINEEDALPVHVLRVNLELAGLVRHRKGRFVLTREGKKLAGPRNAGVLLARLLRTYFASFDIHYGRFSQNMEDLQMAVPLFLWKLRVWAREWTSVLELAHRLLPDTPPDEASFESSPYELRVTALEWRILVALKDFGLLERRCLREPQNRWDSDPKTTEFRTTPLFFRLIRFEWEEGEEEIQDPAPPVQGFLDLWGMDEPQA